VFRTSCPSVSALVAAVRTSYAAAARMPAAQPGLGAHCSRRLGSPRMVTAPGFRRLTRASHAWNASARPFTKHTSPAMITSKRATSSAERRSRFSTDVSVEAMGTPHASAFAANATAASGSTSLAHTSAAPARAAASAATPHPDPTSSTLFPRTNSGWSRMYRATPCPPTQGTAQYGGWRLYVVFDV